MPRITADSIADHVAQQEAAVLEAAVRLFLARGYHQVALGDVAAEVGLARSSLYRYVPDKAHLLVRWYHQVIPRTIAEWRAATSGDGSPLDHLHRWALTYLAWARTPEHTLVQPLLEALPTLDGPTRREVTAQHAEMMGVVADVVAAAGVPPGEVKPTVDLLAGLVLGAARAETTHPGDSVRRRLLAAITAAVLPERVATRGRGS
jgi:AcrR family transcriptional regulator